LREGALPWFHYQSQFADVFARGGFDVVVGNPPWVRAEELAPAVRKHLSLRYRWWRGRRGARGYGHQPDLSVAFLERASELAAPGGTIGFLVPAKLATAGYAATTRSMIAERMTVHALADLGHDPRAAFDATIYPMALVASRAVAHEEHAARLSLEPGQARAWLPQSRLRDGPWLLGGEAQAVALERLTNGRPRLGARFRCHLGVKTGLNEVFLDPKDPIEPELLVWAVRGRDVAPFAVRAEARLLYPHSTTGEPLRELPPRARSYLRRHAARLKARKDYDGGPEWTLFRTGPASAAHRVVWPDLAPCLAAAALTGHQSDRFMPLNSCYLTSVPDAPTALRLCAWLNSTWIRAAAAAVADPAAGRFRRFNARVVEGLPLPAAVLADAELLALGERERAGHHDQAALDACAARLLELDPDTCHVLAELGAAGRHRR
jgi:hypothetical protein